MNKLIILLFILSETLSVVFLEVHQAVDDDELPVLDGVVAHASSMVPCVGAEPILLVVLHALEDHPVVPVVNFN